MPKSLIIKKRPTPKDDGPPFDNAKLIVKPRPVAPKIEVRAKPPKLVSIEPKLPLSEKAAKRIELLAVSRYVYQDSNVKKTWEFPILSVATTGEALDTTSITLAKWIKKGMIPAPVLKRTDTPIGTFYHVDEVKVMARLFLEHQATFRYYREDHVDLRKKLGAAIAIVRAKLFK